MRRTRMDEVARGPRGWGGIGPVLVASVFVAAAVGAVTCAAGVDAPGVAGNLGTASAASSSAAADLAIRPFTARPFTPFVRHICPKVADKPDSLSSKPHSLSSIAILPARRSGLRAQVAGCGAQLPSGVREYDAPRVAAPPAIDGALGEAAWLTAPWTEPFVDIRGEDWPDPSLATRAKVVWDEDHLYIAAELEEPHLWATLAERDAILYREHDFEVFLDPDGDGLDYYELEINALGTEFDLFLDRPYRRAGKANVAWDMAGLRTAVELDGTLNDPTDEDRNWAVEIAIPWAALRPPEGGGAPEAPRSGDEWRINFSRVQWPVEVVGGGYRRAQVPTRENRHPEHNWVWSPQGEIDMHIPEMWGIVRFTEKAKRMRRRDYSQVRGARR